MTALESAHGTTIMNLTISNVADKSSLVEFTSSLESLTQEEAISALQTVVKQESEDWFRLGMVLSNYQKSKDEDAFKDLLSYAAENLSINARKAYYLIDIYDSLIESNISPDQVAEVGWSKLKEFAHLLTADNVEYWVNIAKTNTVKQLLALLKSSATVNAAKGAGIDAALEAPIDAVSKVEDAPALEMAQQVALDTPAPVEASQEVYDAPAPVDYTSDEWKDDGAGNFIAVGTNFSTIDNDTQEEVSVESLVSVKDVNSNIAALAEKLKSYNLNSIVAIVHEIYPNMTILVSEKVDAEISE